MKTFRISGTDYSFSVPDDFDISKHTFIEVNVPKPTSKKFLVSWFKDYRTEGTTIIFADNEREATRIARELEATIDKGKEHVLEQFDIETVIEVKDER